MIGQINKLYIKTRPWKVYSRIVGYLFFEGRPLTTRGQWINPLVFFLYKLEKLLPQIKKIKKPIFILGTGRSGTTVLGIIMSMHKDIAFLNEPKALWYSINSHDDLIGSYTMSNASYFMGEEDASAKQKRDIHKVFSSFLFMTFSTRIVDKYPELIFRIPYVKTFFPDAKFLFLVRNGWDTCASIDMWSQRLGETKTSERHDWWGRNNRKWKLLVEQVIKIDPYFSTVAPMIDDISLHTDMAALEWIVTMKKGVEVMEKYPNLVLRIDYEQLVENPKYNLNLIGKFCELNEDDVFINYGVNILKPIKVKEPFNIHPMIKPLFLDMMETLYPN